MRMSRADFEKVVEAPLDVNRPTDGSHHQGGVKLGGRNDRQLTRSAATDHQLPAPNRLQAITNPSRRAGKLPAMVSEHRERPRPPPPAATQSRDRAADPCSAELR